MSGPESGPVDEEALLADLARIIEWEVTVRVARIVHHFRECPNCHVCGFIQDILDKTKDVQLGDANV